MLQIDQLIACLQSSVNNEDCLQTRNVKVDVRMITFSLMCVSQFIEALGSKRIICTLKKVLRQPHNVLTLQVSLSLPDR